MFPLQGEQQGDLSSSIFLNPAPPHGPGSQWTDFVNGSDVQRGTWTLPAAFSASYNSGGSLQSSQEPSLVIPWPLSGEDYALPGARKQGWQPGKAVYRWGRSKDRKKTCHPGESTVLLVEIHTVMGWRLNGRNKFINVGQHGFKKENEKQHIEILFYQGIKIRIQSYIWKS